MVPPALRFIRPGMSQRSPLGSTTSSAVSRLIVTEAGERPRDMQGRVVRDQQIADRMHAIAQNKRRIFPRRIKHLVIQHKNPVFDSGSKRLDQYRIVVSRNLIEISEQRGFVINRLCEITARSGQGFGEGCCAQFPEIFECRFALMTRGAQGCDAARAGRSSRRPASARRRYQESYWQNICRSPATKPSRCFADTMNIARRRNECFWPRNRR